MEDLWLVRKIVENYERIQWRTHEEGGFRGQPPPPPLTTGEKIKPSFFSEPSFFCAVPAQIASMFCCSIFIIFDYSETFIVTRQYP